MALNISSFRLFPPFIPHFPSQYALQFIAVSVIAGLLLYYTYGQVANLKEEKLIKQRYVNTEKKRRKDGGRNERAEGLNFHAFEKMLLQFLIPFSSSK